MMRGFTYLDKGEASPPSIQCTKGDEVDMPSPPTPPPPNCMSLPSAGQIKRCPKQQRRHPPEVIYSDNSGSTHQLKIKDGFLLVVVVVNLWSVT
eukprot:scaffold14218_cov87-Skeletonema_marinoi.AAC.4